jgi:hypothetical protein
MHALRKKSNPLLKKKHRTISVRCKKYENKGFKSDSARQFPPSGACVRLAAPQLPEPLLH